MCEKARSLWGRELRGPLGGTLHLEQVAAPLVLCGRAGQQQFDKAEDGLQQVVEIMGDSARKPSDSIHFRSVLELCL